MNKISIIIPTFNERGNISHLIKDIRALLYDYNYEIIIVDDDSPDGTYDFVKDLNYKEVRSIKRTLNKGLANSIRCGIEHATGDAIVILDSDFNHDPKLIPFMLKALPYFDCVIASRFVYGGQGLNPIRHLLSWSFNLFLRAITGSRVTDNLLGFFAIHRKILNSLQFDDIFWGFGDYNIRLLHYLQSKQFSILQVPTIIGSRKTGSGNSQLGKTFILYTLSVFKLVLSAGRIWKN